jgi:hypothetical protein
MIQIATIPAAIRNTRDEWLGSFIIQAPDIVVIIQSDPDIIGFKYVCCIPIDSIPRINNMAISGKRVVPP